jgi:hypothetical protein
MLCMFIINPDYFRCMYDSENIFICSHKSKVFSFPRDTKTSEGLARIEHLILSVDDSEEKMVFMVKLRTSEVDQRPKLICYLTSISKTFTKVFSNGTIFFEDEVIYQTSAMI